jgi:hypothetical protein
VGKGAQTRVSVQPKASVGFGVACHSSGRAAVLCWASLNEEAAMGSEDGRMLAIWDVVLLGFVMAMMAGVLTGGPQA